MAEAQRDQAADAAGAEVTPAEAKAEAARILTERGLDYERLSVSTVSFTNPARAEAVVVTVHGWKPSGDARRVQRDARARGFQIEFGAFA